MKNDAPPGINGVIETILYVGDLARTVAFYREVLGLAPMAGDPARFRAFDAGAGRVLLLFKRGATLERTPGIWPNYRGAVPFWADAAWQSGRCGQSPVAFASRQSVS